MKIAKFQLKHGFRLAIFASLFVAASSFLTACGESETTTTTTDTVIAEPTPESAPIIDTLMTDSGRAVMDPKKPDDPTAQ